ncbi:glutathione-s-transferase theta, GST [Aspergillus germanicus]
MQPFTLYSHPLGPNPWKVAIILSALDLPYTTIMVGFENVKKSPFIDINPNGRLPALTDPNKGITLWESSAIITYLVEVYDVDHTLSHDTFHERFYTEQWLHFQATGQGPYYGQLGWFARQEEKHAGAIKRYTDEVYRVTGVLEKALSGREWLVGDKCTYADLAFIPWQAMVGFMMEEGWDERAFALQFPHTTAWLGRMREMPAVEKVLAEKKQAMVGFLAG